MARLDDVDKYADEWTRMQLLIWQEKIERLKVVRSGALHQSFKESVTHASSGGGETTISMKFHRYGIYQALGVGNGYTRDNGGDLPFLGSDYRKEHGLDKPRKVGPKWGGYKTSGKPRKSRDWYFRKLFTSKRAMTEDLARILGDNALRVVCDALRDTRAVLK